MINTNINTLSNEQLYIKYQEAKANFRNAIEGTQEEIKADRIFTELSMEIENREDFDWLSYKLEELNNNITSKECSTMKNIKSIIKTTILAGVITILVSIPAMADNNDPSILNHYTDSKGGCITVYKDGTHYTNTDVEIQSISYIDNSVTIEKDNNLYKFYVDEPRNYYLSEIINVTFNENMEIVNCSVFDKPNEYTTQLMDCENGVAYFEADNNIYSFNYDKETDSWQEGDKCKVIIQNDNVLEVRPIPLNER